MKLALCVGKNNYSGAGVLRGCVNDASDIAEILKNNGWHVELILDSQATVENCKLILADYAKQLNSNHDQCLWTYSGHGTQVVDKNNDEGDGYDEAIYLDKVWLDDDIYPTLKQFNENIDLGVVFDSCFSHSATRNALFAQNNPRYTKARYIEIEPVKPTAKRDHRFLHPKGVVNIPWWHYSGCGDLEYSYDAVFNGRHNGAFTYNWTRALGAFRTHQIVFEIVRKKLPTPQYPQTPTLEGNYANKFLLDASVDIGSINVPEKQTCRLFKKLLTLLISLFKR